jgi:ribosome biogenesis GTPase / thiamine phosphate phosphatase
VHSEVNVDSDPSPEAGWGILLENVGGIHRVRLDDGGHHVEASLRGRLKQEARAGDRLAAGERVHVVQAPDGGWTLESVAPRRSELLRADFTRHRPKVVAANVDRAFVVVAPLGGAIPGERADRFLLLAEASGIPAVLVLNKVDLPDGTLCAEVLEDRFSGSGYPLLRTSAQTGEGIDALRSYLSDGVSVLMGPSGVGKSSLLNAVAPGLELRTGAVSEKWGGGRHTTVSPRLVPVGDTGGWVVDTPGFSDATVWGLDPLELAEAFPEFRPYSPLCRFRGCSHRHEPGCAVRAAVEAGAIHPDRFANYERLASE